eukprot:g44670.t1
MSKLDKGEPVGLICLNFQKAFAKVPCRWLLNKIRADGVGGKVLADETPLFGVSGYEEYLRDQEVAERWYRYNPRLTCLYCGKSFNQKGSLDRHMRLHMGITPFVCRICGKKYTRKDQLEYHIRKHTGNKPFHCHVCGKSFPFQAILNQHFKKNHPGCTLLEGLHSISPETTSKGQNGEESPPRDEAKTI